MKRAASLKALRILNEELAHRPFLVGEAYTVADMSVFAYSHLAGEAGLPIDDFPGFVRWTERVRMQPGFLDRIYPYSIDPHSSGELP